MANSIHIEPLINVDRERYLLQNETKIRSAATSALATGKKDLLLQHAYNAVLYSEDLHESQTAISEAYARRNIAHRRNDHHILAMKAMQLKLRALDHLSHIVGY